MRSTIIHRVLVSIPVLFATVTLVFFILRLLPGDPVQRMLDGTPATPEMIASLNRQFGLDRPLIVQYGMYLRDVLHGDFGTSLFTGENVMSTLLGQFPSTLTLALAGATFAVVFGVLLGVLSAVYRHRFVDGLIRMVSLFSISMPTFWTAILLLLVFSVHLRWLPATGSEGIASLVLPSVVLGFSGSGLIIRMVRNSMLDVIREPFVRTLRAKGLPERTVMYRHVLRNALIPSMTVIGMLVGEMMTGAVVVETIFARPGIGRVVIDAIANKDLPVVQGAILLTATVYIVVNLLVDISYSVIDPRVRQP